MKRSFYNLKAIACTLALTLLTGQSFMAFALPNDKNPFDGTSALIMTSNEFLSWYKSRPETTSNNNEEGFQNIGMRETLKAGIKTFDYEMAPGDRISIKVKGQDQYNLRNVEIDTSGMITMPYIGEFAVNGVTRRALEYEITESLREYLRHPEVYVEINDTRPQLTYVLGAVKFPGPYKQVAKEANLPEVKEVIVSHDLRISTAISNSGGLNPDSDMRNIHVYNDVLGYHKTVNLFDLIVFGSVKNDISLNPNDVVYVPRLHDTNMMDPASFKLIANSTLGTHEYPIRVHGLVKDPNILYMKPVEMTLQAAISKAGGLLPEAKASSVIVARANPDGSLKRLVVDIKKQDILLQPNDTVMVADVRSGKKFEQFFYRISRVLAPPLQASFLLRNMDSVYGLTDD